MMGWRLSLLLLTAVTLHGRLSAETDVLEEKSTRDIVHLYNQREGVTYLYRALEQLSAAKLGTEESFPKKTIVIKETTCLKSDNSPDVTQCDFKSDGDVKICDLRVQSPEDIMCSSIGQKVLVRRRRNKPCNKKNCGPRHVIGSLSPISQSVK
ncbi:cathelicidin-related antimicrobial peptide Bf-CRAMP-like [Dendropsophus ebraccatus]|uniref:cathelicidin-related antimicrobial peptide Bf-CRAMP-like n=1 Tax=Dendropsophus ebraccatus TaxID=150705 RepID=UPI0038313B37